jgi:peptidoglycan/LPS O-acetylase OafA/YrhL
LLPASTLFFDPLDVEGLRFFCYGLPSVVLVYGAVSLEYRSQFQFPQWLRSLGDASFSIYLSHLLIIEVLGRFWKAFHPANPWVHVGMLLLMTAAALTGGFAVHRWLEEPLLRISHRWQPRRPSASLSTDASVVAK